MLLYAIKNNLVTIKMDYLGVEKTTDKIQVDEFFFFMWKNDQVEKRKIRNNKNWKRRERKKERDFRFAFISWGFFFPYSSFVRSKLEKLLDQAGEVDEQATQRMRPASLQVMHLRAANSAVKWLRWMDFLEPEQTEHGR